MAMEILQSLEHQNRDFLEEVNLALARVQGHWDKESGNLLKKDLFLNNEIESEGASLVERKLLDLMVSASSLFVGDGSVSYMILGKSITLPEKDRGLIVLCQAVSVPNPEWRAVAIVDQAIVSGDSMEEIRKRFAKRMSRFSSILDKVSGELGEGKVKERDFLKEIKGDKGELEARINEELARRVGGMNEDQLGELCDMLNRQTSDEMISTSLSSARNILSGILKEKMGTIVHSYARLFVTHEPKN